MSKKKKTIIAIIAILAITIVGLGAGVIAKYFTEFTTGEGKLTVAKWAFKGDNEESTNLSCVITDPTNVNPATLVSDRIAPGTSGTCTFKLVNTNSEVGVDYTISVAEITNAPKNLILKKGTTVLKNDGSTSFTGTLAAKDNVGVDVVIDWEWPYETGENDTEIAAADGDDTADGEGGKQMVVKFNIKGVQVRPAAQ